LIACITLEAARSGGNFKYPVPNAGKAIDVHECLLADSKHFFTKLYKTCMKIIVKIVIFGGTNDWAKIEQVFIIFAPFYIFVIWSFSSLHDHFVCHFFLHWFYLRSQIALTD
jgi:hypothetical protein